MKLAALDARAEYIKDAPGLEFTPRRMLRSIIWVGASLASTAASIFFGAIWGAARGLQSGAVDAFGGAREDALALWNWVER